MYPLCPSSGSELVVLPSLSPDSSDTSEELPHRMSSLASKYSAAESATEGGPWDERLTASGWHQGKKKKGMNKENQPSTIKKTKQDKVGQRVQMTNLTWANVLDWCMLLASQTACSFCLSWDRVSCTDFRELSTKGALNNSFCWTVAFTYFAIKRFPG